MVIYLELSSFKLPKNPISSELVLTLCRVSPAGLYCTFDLVAEAAAAHDPEEPPSVMEYEFLVLP